MLLRKHPAVQKVDYPGFGDCPNAEAQQAQAKNGGSLLSFDTGRQVLARTCNGS